jgi:hypothetical protein
MKSNAPVVLAIHPGEVMADAGVSQSMALAPDGIITVQESVEGMLRVIKAKGKGGIDEGGIRSSGGAEMRGAATFWTWEGKKYPW